MKSLFFLLFFLINYSFAALPNLTHRGVRDKMQQILTIHVTQKAIDQDLSRKILALFLEEIDPTKTYFTEEDLGELTDPKTPLLDEMVTNFRYAKYPVFYAIREKFVEAIQRRRLLEEEVENLPLLTEIPKVAWDELGWTKSTQELKDRLLLVRSLQEETARTLDKETQEIYRKMVKKRRNINETSVLTHEKKAQENWILIHVLKAFCTSLDANTSYFTPREAVQFMIQVQQRLFGIGAQLRDTFDGFSVVRVLEGGPADLSGKLQRGDRIIAVDAEPIVGLSIFDAVEKIRGEKDTPVRLTILREQTEKSEEITKETLEIEITRGEVVLEESRLQTDLEPFADGVLAHIKLFSFYQDPNHSSSKDIKKALEEAQKEAKVKGVILDLRNNSGGLLDEAVKVSSLFMDNGIVVSIKDNQGHVRRSRSQGGKAFWNGPLIVLTNKVSASAAEIVAGTLQDYGKALVVGDTRTFGKGTFQTVTLDAASQGKVSDQGEFRVTRGIYYTASGKSPQLVGVTPDILVPGPLHALDIGECFGKFPIDNDTIPPCFEDDLSDIPLLQRKKLGSYYQKYLQEISSFYEPYKPILEKNSATRIEKSAQYQCLIKETEKEKYDPATLEMLGKADPQLQECFHIMKDLLSLMRTDPSKTPLSYAEGA
ncbi:MAG: S41 family peptidase [Chlamydiota bacterium]